MSDRLPRIDSQELIRALKRAGFVPSERGADLSSARGLGLRGMRERAELIGGTLSVTSRLGKGTVVEVTTPA